MAVPLQIQVQMVGKPENEVSVKGAISVFTFELSVIMRQVFLCKPVIVVSPLQK